jgi:outer membrane protein OmpA-like peptidoglycan-associated protein
MISRFMSRKKIAAFVFVSCLVPFQGCATRSWVGDQISPMNDRISKLEGQVGQVESRLPAVENRLTAAENRIAQVTSKADETDAKADKALMNISNLRLERRLELKLDDGVLYRLNSATLTKEGKKSIDIFLSDIRNEIKGPQIFVVGGHTDSAGTARYNYELGRKRAQSVAEYLVLDKKIDPMRVVTVSFGESSPSPNNGIRDGRGKNRRVEIRVYSDVIATSAGTPMAQR